MKTIVGMVMILAAAGAYGQMLKCVGPDGKIEYSNQCPPGTREQAIGIRSSPGTPAPAASSQPKSYIEQDAEFKKRLLDKEDARQKDEKKVAETEQLRLACENSRSYLKSLQEGQRITRSDPKTGEIVFLEDAQRAGEIARAQRAVESNCR